MATEHRQQVERLVRAALEHPPHERSVFLEGACLDDVSLRKEVEAVLASRQRSASSPQGPHSTTITAVREDGTSLEGREIGHYKLLQEIGEGGMGVVYEAEQQEPVRRKVALKLIKWGMDTKQVIARFESERQALALMNHPNIASVFDAGATNEGRPYFAMEFVKGIPITEYCDKHRLTIRERLHLFIQVCEGIQHAHQKGIIHRDIKPSNVLVAIQNDRPVPKIIDFGVAKATSQRLTAHSVYTELGQLIGTPEYMSPEQAEMTNLDIDTRTDVYSLGVLFYELLVGAQPFDPKALREAGLFEIQRKLREDDPPRPSTRLSELGEASTTSASNRRVEVRALGRQLKGDLDWIAMKALEKDRTRRFETANAFALDVERYLRSEPIRARAPSALYRAGRFIHRHRAGVATAAGFVGLLIGVMVLTLVQSAQIAKGRDRAEQAREEVEEVVEFMVDLFEVSDPMESPGGTITAREILDRGAERIDSELDDQPLTKARMLQTIGRVYQSLGLYEVAEQLKEEALAIRRRELGNEHPDVAHSLDSLASLAYARADYDSAEASSRESLSIYRRFHGEEHADIAGALSDLGIALSAKGELESTERVQREALEMARGLPDIDDESLELYVRRLAIDLEQLGAFEEAEPLYRESLELSRKIYGQEHPRVAMALDNLAILFDSSEDYVRAEPLYRESLAMLRRVYGERHPEVAQTMGNLAAFLIYSKGPSERGSKADYEEAEQILRQALEMNREFRPDHPFTGDVLADLGELRLREGNHVEAERVTREALRIYRLKLPERHRRIVFAKTQLGEVVLALGRLEEAEPLLLDSHEALRAEFKEEDEEIELVVENLIELYESWGKPEKAAEYRALLEKSEGTDH